MRANQEIHQPSEITLVDDVVTRGSTLLAAASLVKSVYPDSKIRTFAFSRTLGFVDDIERIIDPCEGIIRWDGYNVTREP